MPHWKLRLGDEFMLDGVIWKVSWRRDTKILARSISEKPRGREFYLWRVFRDGHLVKSGPDPSGENSWRRRYSAAISATLEQVPKNLDRPASVKHNSDGIHICLTLSRVMTSKMPDGTSNWKHAHLYFTLPAGSGMPSIHGARDALVGDCIGFEDAPGLNTWMRPHHRRKSLFQSSSEDIPGMEVWAIEHGYTVGAPETTFAYNFVRKRSRKLWGLGSQDLYHSLLWDTPRLPNNDWEALLSVAGQIPPRAATGSK
jgi:hypothetical protein